jgi:hypothetical protein
VLPVIPYRILLCQITNENDLFNDSWPKLNSLFTSCECRRPRANDVTFQKKNETIETVRVQEDAIVESVFREGASVGRYTRPILIV